MTTKKATKAAQPVTDSSAAAADEAKVVLVTKEGFEKLGQELEYLKNVKRREVAERLQEAISYGDLSENSEYEDAKNEQAFVEGRVLELEDKIKHAKVIDDKQKKVASVQLGSTVWVKQVGKSLLQEFTIVGSTEADPVKKRISNLSPVGSALLESRVGERVKVHAPAGTLEYEITKVE